MNPYILLTYAYEIYKTLWGSKYYYKSRLYIIISSNIIVNVQSFQQIKAMDLKMQIYSFSIKKRWLQIDVFLKEKKRIKYRILLMFYNTRTIA